MIIEGHTSLIRVKCQTMSLSAGNSPESPAECQPTEGRIDFLRREVCVFDDESILYRAATWPTDGFPIALRAVSDCGCSGGPRGRP